MKPQVTPFLRRHGELLIGVALVAAVFTAYWGVFGHAFVNFDDPLYVTENPHLNLGFSREGIHWAFSTLYANFWHPLTWLSYFADVEVFGWHPGGFLFTNLMLHVFSTLILFAALRHMTDAPWRSALVAALFALHPLNVESVAWVAERKNVLSTLCWMLTLWGYSRYARQPGPGRYAAVLAFFVLGLMAKPMLVTLPFVLLLIDYWPLGRWSSIPQTDGGAPNGRAAPFGRLFFEKLPLLVLSAGFSAIAYLAQHRGGALPSVQAFPMTVRAANAVVSYAIYLRKTIWPVDLTLFYPHPGMPSWQAVAGAAVFIGLVTALALKRFRTQPWLIVGWLWYLGTLVPVIGLVQIGSFAMADRFAYVPLIGVFIMLAWTGAGRRKTRRHLRVPALCWGMLLVTMLGVTRQQVGYWQNSAALFGHALTVAGGHPFIYNSLGEALAAGGDVDGAVRHYREALRLDPGNGEIMSNLAAALSDLGALDEAAGLLQEALRADPSLSKAHINLGNLHALQGRLELAVADYRRALDLDPLTPTACNNLGVALARQGRIAEAIVQFERALQLMPGYASARKNMAYFTAVLNREKEERSNVQP